MLRIGHLDDLLSPVWKERPALLEAIQQRSLTVQYGAGCVSGASQRRGEFA